MENYYLNNYIVILPILSTLLSLWLGIFTLSKNPKHPVTIGFALAMLSLAANETGSIIILLSSNGGAILLGMQVSLIGQSVFSAACFFFSTIFARTNYREILSRWLLLIIGAGIISIIFIALVNSPDFIFLPSSATEVIDWENNLRNNAPLFFIGRIGRYFYIYLLFVMALSIVNFESTLRSSSGTKRWQIKHLIFGIGAILAFFIYLSSQKLLFSTIKAQYIPLTSTILIISETIIAVFMARHRLLNVDIFVSRYVVYNSLAILIVGIYLVSVGIIAYGVKYLHIPFSYFFIRLLIFVSIFALISILFNARLRRKFQLFINRHFYKHKYEFRDKWMETIDRISSKRSVEEIIMTLKEMVSETMGAKGVRLWLCDTNYWRYTTVDDVAADCKTLAQDHPILKRIEAENGPFIIDKPRKPEKEGQNKEIERLASSTGSVLCAPLAVGNEVVGFILQGGDLSGESYRQDDFEFLKAITTQAAVQIKNIWLTQELIIAKEIDAFSKMSSFILHDLKNLTNSLSLISQNAKYNIDNPEFQKDAILTIDSTVPRMKGLIGRLSSVPKNIEIKREDVSLNILVHSALKRLNTDGEKNVVITEELDSIPPICIDHEAMEMVFLNLITNAYEAIEKEGIIRVTSSMNQGNINIKVSDTGAGMSEEYIENCVFKPFRSTKKSGFGIGLYQCKTIVDAHGGKIEVESKKGMGTTFTIKLPMHCEDSVEGGVIEGR